MNIDKFGHHVHKRMRLSDVLNFSEESVLKVEHGEINLHLNRMRGVKTPTESDDVVNKEYVDKITTKSYTKTDVDLLISACRSSILKDVDSKLKTLKAELPDVFDQYLRKKYSEKVKQQND